ncbi:MAG: Hsp70 family protein, partial [Proteobacteria bacterium]|nr:Hsp70 family protein [Pseudomonadota bacterium]
VWAALLAKETTGEGQRVETSLLSTAMFAQANVAHDFPAVEPNFRKQFLADIPVAPRGLPQIEVKFDIDANGILNVSAKDKATGKSQTIVIKASSGLGEDEIDKIVAEAETHAEDDRKFRELVDVRNQADALIHASEKTLADLGEKASAEERLAVENAVADLKTALEGNEKDTLQAKIAALGEASGSLAQKLYAEQAAAGAEGGTESSQAADGDVVDAEFEEVDKDDLDKDDQAKSG